MSIQQVAKVPERRLRSTHPEVANRHAVVRTTLYDLIEAMHAVTSPAEDDWVVRAIMHLFASGQIAFLDASTQASGTRRREEKEDESARQPVSLPEVRNAASGMLMG